MEKAGYEICGIARTVPVAQEIIRKEKPELVLLDIFLKGRLTGIDLGAAGIAIHSFPPAGIVRLELLSLNKWWRALGLFSSVQKPYRVPFENWKNDISNDMPGEQQRQSYYDYSTPESKQVVRDAFSGVKTLNCKGHHPPLLLTSGGRDRLVPSLVNFKNYKEYKKQEHSITDYKEFKDSNHLVFGQRECMDEAEFIVCWLKRLPIKT